MASENLKNIENYRELFLKSHLGVFTATLEGKYIEVNETLSSILGYNSCNELLTEIKDISNEIFAIRGDRDNIIKQLLKQKQILSHETKFKKKSGDLISVKINYNLIYNKNNETFIVGLVEDITNQIQTKTELLKEKYTLQYLIEKIPDYIYLKDLTGKIQIANKSVRNLLESRNYKNSTEELIAKQLFLDDEKILGAGDCINDKLVEIDLGNGNKDFISLSKHPILDNEKGITGLIGIGRNLTDLKQAERQIIKSQANLSALIESSNELIIWSVDTNLRLVTFNTAFNNFIYNQSGRQPEIGNNILNLFQETKSNFWKTCYDKTLTGEKLIEETTFNDKPNLFFECSFNPIYDRSTIVTGISVILTDISERKITEKAIRESEERFRQLAENTNDAFILWDNQGMLYANPAFEKIYGISIEQAMNDFSLIEQLIDEEDRKRFLRNRKRETSGKHNTRNQQYLLKKSKRYIKKIWARHYPVYNDKGKIYRHVTVTSDITEQKNLEEVLTATRSQQQALLDNIPFLAWLKDYNGRYISINHPFCSFFKLKPDNIIGKTDFDILPYDDAKRNTDIDRIVIATGERKHTEHSRKTSFGEEWVEVYKSPIFNEKGEVIGLTGISREITDRKRLEEAIKKNEEHFRALLRYSSDAITILDKEGIITFESSLRNRILNFTVEELVGKPFSEIIHPEDIEIYKSAFTNCLDNPGIQIKKEYRSLHKNKRWIYVESIFTNHLHNPSINGIVVNTRDVSDRKMAELKEKAYHNNLIFLSNSALDLLSLSDKENILSYICNKLYEFLENSFIIVSTYNEKAEKCEIKQISQIDKWTPIIQAIYDRPLIGITYDKDPILTNIDNAGAIIAIKEFSNAFKKVLTKFKEYGEKEGIFSLNKIYNITLARDNKLLGNITIITLNKTIVKFKHIIETFAHQVSVALHRSQLETELINAKLKAEESDRLKTAFLANMSHEIRTPMNGILGFAEMLNDGQLSEDERKKYLEIINNNGKILINLIDDIIDFAKIEAGQVKITYHNFSLNALLNQIYTSLLTDRLKFEKPGISVKYTKEFSDEESFINSDPNRIRQIITNLVSNAVKFTNDGQIELGYHLKDNAFLEFYVKDSGIGIEKTKLKAIFDRFVQADNSRSRKYSGSGLGLAISKGFVSLLGGEMWAESEFGKGSTFYFTIPYKAGKSVRTESEGAKRPKSTYNWENKKILIAEDDFFSYKFLEGFLRQTKANILHADDGKKAVEICAENDDIDIILMDVQMPEMNGMDATRTIKKTKRTLPIIAQTANAISEEKQKCFEAGFDDFVTKPINISELFMKIDHWLVQPID